MEKRRRSERLIASLRWIVILLGMAAASDGIPVLLFAALLGFVVLYNGLLTYLLGNPAFFAAHCRKLFIGSRLLDTAVVTYAVMHAEPENPLTYLLYWFVLVSFGFVSSDLRNLAIATLGVLAANSVACYYDAPAPDSCVLAR